MIYLLDENPRDAAERYDDKTLKRAPREAAQVLANAVAYYGVNPEGHKPNQAYPEITRWVSRSRSNWRWFIRLAYALCYEYSFRTGKVHKSQEFITWARNHPPYNQPELGRQPYPYSEKALDEVGYRHIKNQIASWEFLFVMKNDSLTDKDFTFRDVPGFYKQRLTELSAIEALREKEKADNEK